MSIQELPREEVARLAYQLWEQRGCPIGSPEVDWERAEKALRYDAATDSASESGERGEAQGEEASVVSIEGMDVSAQRDDSASTLDGAAPPKSSRRPPKASTRTNEGPRRSTQVR